MLTGAWLMADSVAARARASERTPSSIGAAGGRLSRMAASRSSVCAKYMSFSAATVLDDGQGWLVRTSSGAPAVLDRTVGEVMHPVIGAAAESEQLYVTQSRLSERLEQRAETLSGGEQQMLAIGRALMTRPRLLMLDEPSQGIMPKLVDEIFQAVKRIRDAGMTVLIVEQRMAECLEIADRAYILQTGRVLMQGAASEIRTDPDVRKAYLGL